LRPNGSGLSFKHQCLSPATPCHFYFSCPPRKVEEKMAGGNYLEIQKADFQTAITSFQGNHRVRAASQWAKPPPEGCGRLFPFACLVR
jgi:hypothetical protein